jgi:hypothetical protein
MTDTATPETGPVDAPASIESIVAELEAGVNSLRTTLRMSRRNWSRRLRKPANPKRNPVLRLRPNPLKEAPETPEEGTPEEQNSSPSR